MFDPSKFKSGKKKFLEKDIEESNRRYAITLGYLFEKFTSPNKRSVPDRMLTNKHGFIFFIEYKAPGKTATEKQLEDHEERRSRGNIVYVVDDIRQGEKIIMKYANTEPFTL